MAMSTMRAPKKARSVVANMPMMYPTMYPGMFPAAGMPHQHMMAPPPSQQQMMMGADDESDEGTEAGLPAGIPTPQQNPSGVEFQHQLAAPPLSSLPQPEVPVPMEDGHQRLANSQISRSITYVKNIPRNRISEVMEEVDPSLDPAFSSELSTDGLLTVMWLYCRVKPTVRISDLRDLAWYKRCDNLHVDLYLIQQTGYLILNVFHVLVICEEPQSYLWFVTVIAQESPRTKNFANVWFRATGESWRLLAKMSLQHR